MHVIDPLVMSLNNFMKADPGALVPFASDLPTS